MFGQAIPHSLLWLVSCYAVLIIGIIGCGGDVDENDWVGTWEIEIVDGKGFEQAPGEKGVTASIITNNWTFNDDETWTFDFAVKLELDITYSFDLAGTYSLFGSDYTLTFDTFTFDGIESNFLGDLGSETDTGTWSRSGNTLTLNSDTGETIVFKKR